MNLLYNVGKGSEKRPAMVSLCYKGNPDLDSYTALVGKGIIYDTGGLNIKPTGGMEPMYLDKCGASAVFATMKAIATLGLKVNVVAALALAENSVSGSAYRPSDIIESMKGITVEIGNTDAEGRLAMASAMTWVQREYKVHTLIQLATLTGAILVALGKRIGGLFSNSDELSAKLTASTTAFNEPLWRLPIPEEVAEGMEGKVSDAININRAVGCGSGSAAAFLRLFIEEGVEWAHLDIAGSSVAWTNYGNFNQYGATGFGVGLLLEYFSKL